MKQLRIFLAVLLTVTTLSHSRPSQAAVGAAFSGGVLIAGIVVAAGGAGTLAIGVRNCRGDTSGLCKGLWGLFMLPVIGIGLVMLDGEQQVQFNELSKEQAAKLGVSASELAIYNSEVDQANMLVADVSSELSKLEKPTVEDSGVAWSAVKDMVSAETYATMQKIVSQK